MIYYIYHIPEVKIGCTNNLDKRMADQGFTDWEILETHEDGWIAGDREIELQKQYGYPVDKSHYMVSLNNRNNWQEDKLKVKEARRKALATKILNNTLGIPGSCVPAETRKKISRLGGLSHRTLTKEEVIQIRQEYSEMRKYGAVVKLAKKYNSTVNIIGKLVRGLTYKDV